MNIEDRLNALKGIKKIDAPPFLLTRIVQQINTLKTEEVSAQWTWGFALAFVAILALNISILLAPSASPTKKNNSIETIVSSLNLSTTNDLYNE